MIEDNDLDRIGAVVVDELHLLGDKSRGFLVELLLAKICFHNQKQIQKEKCIRLVGMSATIPNLDEIGAWLGNALVFKTDYRPVPLSQYLVSRHNVYDTKGRLMRKLVPFSNDDKDGLLSLCEESIMNNHGCLVFCSTKDACTQLAVMQKACLQIFSSTIIVKLGFAWRMRKRTRK